MLVYTLHTNLKLCCSVNTHVFYKNVFNHCIKHWLPESTRWGIPLYLFIRQNKIFQKGVSRWILFSRNLFKLSYWNVLISVNLQANIYFNWYWKKREILYSFCLCVLFGFFPWVLFLPHTVGIKTVRQTNMIFRNLIWFFFLHLLDFY